MLSLCHETQDSLGGNAKSVIIANVSPAAACLRESQSTLAFAQRAQQIVNKAVVNEAMHGEQAVLTRENKRLRSELRLLNDTCRVLQQVSSEALGNCSNLLHHSCETNRKVGA